MDSSVSNNDELEKLMSIRIAAALQEVSVVRPPKLDRWVPNFFQQKRKARKNTQTTLDPADYRRANELAHDLRCEVSPHENIR